MTKFDGATSRSFDDIAQTSQAIWGGDVDPSNPASDVVVELLSPPDARER